MVAFSRRDKHTIKMPNKPIGKGFKVWCLAESGYIITWLFYSKKLGPLGLEKEL